MTGVVVQFQIIRMKLTIVIKVMKAEKKLAFDKKLCNLVDEYRQDLSSEVALLAKLGIRSFSYGLVVLFVYDNGSVFNPKVLNSTEDDLVGKFITGVSMVASLSLALYYLTLVVAPWVLINTYKNLFTVVVDTEYTFIQVEGTSQGSKKISFKSFLFSCIG
ncbi:60S acidic ribosomal protein P0-like [Asparagus officinalis]|uniref:60S acidic ribosomal protein P0-like n=1 Tax=Asparagus officinalis TaxID=4686 RepID=UPI00098E3D41|nr:60S acidic ribosomal protein P0-like [Asparagus officinalis]